MSRTAHMSTPPPVQAARIAERLLAHARLCRQVARANADGEIADMLLQIADECARTAGALQPARQVSRRHRAH